MTTAEAFRHPRPAQLAAKAGSIVAVWAGVKEWSRGVPGRLLAVEAACDDPTAAFDMREWADLPTHHPGSPE